MEKRKSQTKQFNKISGSQDRKYPDWRSPSIMDENKSLTRHITININTLGDLRWERFNKGKIQDMQKESEIRMASGILNEQEWIFKIR